MSNIPRQIPSKYPSKAGLCQLNHAAIRPHIRQRRGCVRYATPLTVEMSVKDAVVADITRHQPSKYPSKPGLCQIYHATIRPNIRQRRVVSDIPIHLFINISVKDGLCQIYHATIRPHIRQWWVLSDIPRHYPSTYPSKAGCVRYTTQLSVHISVEDGLVRYITTLSV